MDILDERHKALLCILGRSLLAMALLVPASFGSQALAQKPAIPAPAPEPPAGSVSGMGDVNVFPKRVVIDQKQRVASVGLFNRSAVQSEYDITLTDMMMTPEGRLVDLASVADPAVRARVKAASSLLRWSPRRVTLASHDSQTIRIMARVAPDLAPGEYRTHFSAVAVPNNANGNSIEAAAGTANANSVGVMIVPRFGISIPVILRVGDTTLTAGLRDMSVVTQPGGERAIVLTITREGTRSAFGDLTVTVTGTKSKVTEIKGVGVYTEVGQRTVHIPLDPALDPRLIARGAKLTVTYTDDDFAPGKILARQDFIVP